MFHPSVFSVARRPQLSEGLEASLLGALDQGVNSFPANGGVAGGCRSQNQLGIIGLPALKCSSPNIPRPLRSEPSGFTDFATILTRCARFLSSQCKKGRMKASSWSKDSWLGRTALHLEKIQPVLTHDSQRVLQGKNGKFPDRSRVAADSMPDGQQTGRKMWDKFTARALDEDWTCSWCNMGPSWPAVLLQQQGLRSSVSWFILFLHHSQMWIHTKRKKYIYICFAPINSHETQMDALFFLRRQSLTCNHASRWSFRISSRTGRSGDEGGLRRLRVAGFTGLLRCFSSVFGGLGDKPVLVLFDWGYRIAVESCPLS